MRGSNSKPLQILPKRQRRAPTCSQSACKMLTKHANARFPGPMSSRARGSISKVLQMLKIIDMFGLASKLLQGPQKNQMFQFFLCLIFFCFDPSPLMIIKTQLCVCCMCSYHAQSCHFHPSIVFLNLSRKDCMVFRGEGIIETQRETQRSSRSSSASKRTIKKIDRSA